jgi:hypothetical protein
MRTLATPAVGYVSAVFGVIAVAYLAVFNLQGMAAKAQRHWDAEIDRIIAKQQEKKRLLESTAPGQVDPKSVPNAEPSATTLTTGSVVLESVDTIDAVGPQKVRNQIGKRHGRRAERSQHFLPTAFVTLPKFAANAAATTVLKLR